MVMPIATHETEHDVVLQGVWNAGGSSKPAIVERKDEDFLDAMLSELQAANPDKVVTEHRPTLSSGALRLHQPVHRVFNVVVVEAHCEAFMQPRLDPRKIESSGFVVRRVVRQKFTGKEDRRSKEREIRKEATTYEAWYTENGRVVGWKPLNETTLERDPDPKRRRAPRLTGDRSLDAELFGAPDSLAEEVTTLFVAPPGIATATGRTLLYGVIPTSSTSRAGRPAKGDEPDRAEWESHLSLLLKETDKERALWPADNSLQRQAKLSRDDLKAFTALTESAIPSVMPNPGATRFILLVRQLAQEFSLLRPVNAETRDQLVSALNQLQVPLVDGSSRKAGDYLRDVAGFYFEETAQSTSSLPRPRTWPKVSKEVAEKIYRLLRQVASEVELQVLAGEGSAGRFDDPTAHYVVQAFIRVKRPADCPPKIVWSKPSDEFAIVPWYESGPVAPVQVALPDPFDPNFLKAARPGVAFSVPRKLANAMNQDPKKLMEGSAGSGDLGLDWICGFNIPIITICAFVVLNIFLSLLNIIFWWLPFVKICIPFPRKK
jgi:hypothetical protein